MSKLILKDENGKQYTITDQDEFDNKVNVTNSLYLLKQTPYDLQNVLSNEYRDKTLGVIHNQFIDSASTILGNYDSLLVFGGDDVKHSIDIGLDSHKVRISTKSGGRFWQEDLVLKSDYDKLANRVSALEKQIGGVLTSLYTKLCGTFTSLEVA